MTPPDNRTRLVLNDILSEAKEMMRVSEYEREITYGKESSAKEC